MSFITVDCSIILLQPTSSLTGKKISRFMQYHDCKVPSLRSGMEISEWT